MGILSLLGMIISFATIFAGIVLLGGDLSNFIDPASILLTVVPTIGAMLTSIPFSELAKIPGHFKVLIVGLKSKPENYIDQIIQIATKARVEGILSLEQMEGEIKDPFLGHAVRLVVDGAEEDRVVEALSGDISGIQQRHAAAWAVYDKGAALAPAFGMCATVVALINMLMGLDFSDPAAINSLGANMSAALVTTFYGSLLANIIFIPISSRLKELHKQEIFCKELIIDSVRAIQRGENPKSLRTNLLERLSPKVQRKLGKSED